MSSELKHATRAARLLRQAGMIYAPPKGSPGDRMLSAVTSLREQQIHTYVSTGGEISVANVCRSAVATPAVPVSWSPRGVLWTRVRPVATLTFRCSRASVAEAVRVTMLAHQFAATRTDDDLAVEVAL